MNRRVRDRILLLLAIKPGGKKVNFKHVYEKVSRDSGASKNEILKALNELVKEGLVKKVGNDYMITDDGREFSKKFVYDDDLNLSYRLVLISRLYYPKASKYILPFLKGRPVSVIKVFSDEKDPIHKVKPIFSRYRKFKPRVYNYINSQRDLDKFINMHAIDFIPYVHREGLDYPDWLVIDLDAGDKIKKAGDLGFELVKDITLISANLMEEKLEMKPCVKFSGSRGFQIWVSFSNPIGSFEDYRKAVVIIQKMVEKELEEDFYHDLKEKYGDLIEKPLTTSIVAKKKEREKQILFDWSSLKPEGDVRAPFSMHYKTGLISVPVKINEVGKFQINWAKFENVLKGLDKAESSFKLEPSSTDEIKEKIKHLVP